MTMLYYPKESKRNITPEVNEISKNIKIKV